MTTIHFIYPHGSRISCPDAIGREVGKRLREQYDIIQYDWDDIRVIKPDPGDILLGHPHPAPWTIFQRSVKQPGWKRILMLAPFAPDYAVQQAFEDALIRRSDLYLAITGNYWFSTAHRSLFAYWQPKMVHVDLAVDRNDFPVLKKRFNTPGNRRFLYIGSTSRVKNTVYLTELAKLMPASEMSWIGGSQKQNIPGLQPLGFQNFQEASARKLVAEHDFMITVGTTDAKSTTILEAMAWSLIPVCTPQSGYTKYAGIPNIPLNDPLAAVQVLHRLQFAPEEELQEMQSLNWSSLDQHFHWDRFTTQIIAAIETSTPQVERKTSWIQRVRIQYATVQSAFYFRRLLASTAYALLQQRLQLFSDR